ncbi:MAG TPA: hypothetical protein VHO01_07480 [Jatrophihabitans sp.]|nr:hypothetical protein [Jatrophihabitans sp.]
MRIDRRGISPIDAHGVIEFERFRPEPPINCLTWSATSNDFSTNFSTRSIQMYSMYEAFARERMREQLQRSAAHRLSSDLASARMWRRLASFSARHAARSSGRLAQHGAEEYQLAA